MLRGMTPLLRGSFKASRPTTLSAAWTGLRPTPLQASSQRPSLAPAYCLSPFFRRESYATGPYDKVDVEAEKKLAREKVEARPEDVSVDSTTRQVYEPSPASPAKEENIRAGLEHDIGIVKDTFQMNDVPREPYLLGIAGTLPYMATSVATVYLSWDLNTQWPTGSAFLNHIHLNHSEAQYWLGLLEPIQLGYGAVIISFLGAVHWGMEYASRQAVEDRKKFRYGIGVVAPAVAWPTLLMPVEAALIAQFTAFTALYLADSRATTRGWAPPWYGRYRFILTAIVGAAIFICLVGRAKIGADAPRLGQSLSKSMHANAADRNVDWQKLEEEEKKARKEKEREERKKKEEEAAEKGAEKKSARGDDEAKGDSKNASDETKAQD